MVLWWPVWLWSYKDQQAVKLEFVAFLFKLGVMHVEREWYIILLRNRWRSSISSMQSQYVTARFTFYTWTWIIVQAIFYRVHQSFCLLTCKTTASVRKKKQLREGRRVRHCKDLLSCIGDLSLFVYELLFVVQITFPCTIFPLIKKNVRNFCANDYPNSLSFPGIIKY
jgi:hypothetical protein